MNAFPIKTTKIEAVTNEEINTIANAIGFIPHQSKLNMLAESVRESVKNMLSHLPAEQINEGLLSHVFGGVLFQKKILGFGYFENESSEFPIPKTDIPRINNNSDEYFTKLVLNEDVRTTGQK